MSSKLWLFLGKSGQDRSVVAGPTLHMENLSAGPALQQGLVGVDVVDMGGEPGRARDDHGRTQPGLDVNPRYLYFFPINKSQRLLSVSMSAGAENRNGPRKYFFQKSPSPLIFPQKIHPIKLHLWGCEDRSSSMITLLTCRFPPVQVCPPPPSNQWSPAWPSGRTPRSWETPSYSLV